MRSGTKRVSPPPRLLAAVLLFLLSVVPRVQGLETAQIPPPDPSSTEFFGSAVALSADGQRAIVSAPQPFVWVVYIFVHNGNDWVLEDRLFPDPATAASFGSGVALSADGTVALVSDTNENCTNTPFLPTPCGGVYFYTRTGSVWTLRTHISQALNSDFEFFFGTAMALSADGSTVLVGRPSDDCVHQPCRGVVFVYERSGNSWSLVDTLRASNPSVQQFGDSISLVPDGSTALIGAPKGVCDAASVCGEAYVFTRGGGGWSEQARLTPFDGAFQGYFGSAVGLSADGQTALIGSPAGDFDPPGSGSVYAYARSGNAWTGAQKITGGSLGVFGRYLSFAADGRSVLLGEPFGGCAPSDECGAVYRMVSGPGGLWSPPQPLLSFPAGSRAGRAIALSGDGSLGLAGAPGASCVRGPFCGTVYVFSGLAATIDVPTLGGPGLAVLTIMLILSALLLLRRRRSI